MDLNEYARRVLKGGIPGVLNGVVPGSGVLPGILPTMGKAAGAAINSLASGSKPTTASQRRGMAGPGESYRRPGPKKEYMGPGYMPDSAVFAGTARGSVGGGNAGASITPGFKRPPTTGETKDRVLGSRMAEMAGNAGMASPVVRPVAKPYWSDPANSEIKEAASAEGRPLLGQQGYLEREDIKAWMEANRGKGMIGGKGPDIVDRMILQHQAKLPEDALSEGDNNFESPFTAEQQAQMFQDDTDYGWNTPSKVEFQMPAEGAVVADPASFQQAAAADLGLGARAVGTELSRTAAYQQVQPSQLAQSMFTDDGSLEVAYNDSGVSELTKDIVGNPQTFLRAKLNAIQGLG